MVRRAAPAVKPPLCGRTIVVTRPAAQADALAAAIESAGGTALRFPLLAIAPVEDVAPLIAVAQRLEQYDYACFISPNAVEHALAVVLRARAWPAHLHAVTVGTSSEAALARHGIGRVIAPRERFDSEALLELPELAPVRVAGKRVVIFRGDGGRELLGDTLAARGAQVEYVSCYHRSRPASDPAQLVRLAQDGALDAITLTSSEGADNLVELLGAPKVVLTGAADAGLLAGLVSHFRDR